MMEEGQKALKEIACGRDGEDHGQEEKGQKRRTVNLYHSTFSVVQILNVH